MKAIDDELAAQTEMLARLQAEEEACMTKINKLRDAGEVLA